MRIEPDTHLLEGRDSIRFDTPRAATLVLSARFRIDSLLVDARRIDVRIKSVDGFQRISLPAARRIDLGWSGALAPLARNLDHRGTLTYAEPASSKNGTFLPSGSGWYPAVDGSIERYSLELDLPAEQRGLVPGRLIEERLAGGRYRARFEFRQPAEGIALMAGPYRIEERYVRTAAGSEVRLRSYFHAEIAALASGYLDSIAGYLDLYERWIGAYPFSEFSVVSSPTPTGFGLPTLTYLGIDVLRLPFIRATSLGHEVLHNWWGKSILTGNWSDKSPPHGRLRPSSGQQRGWRGYAPPGRATMRRHHAMILVRFTSGTQAHRKSSGSSDKVVRHAACVESQTPGPARFCHTAAAPPMICA